MTIAEKGNRRTYPAIIQRPREELLAVGLLHEFEAGGPTVEEKAPREEWGEEVYDEISGAPPKSKEGVQSS